MVCLLRDNAKHFICKNALNFSCESLSWEAKPGIHIGSIGDVPRKDSFISFLLVLLALWLKKTDPGTGRTGMNKKIACANRLGWASIGPFQEFSARKANKDKLLAAENTLQSNF